MLFKSLGSGSTGNATVVQTNGAAKCTLLIDCGFGLKSLLFKLEEAGLSIDEVDAIFITHEHGDHVGCVAALSAKHCIPVWMSAGTANATGFDKTSALLHITHDGDTIDLGQLQLTPFTVPHDAQEPLQLCCSDGNVKLGLLTDLGHASEHVLSHLKKCYALLLECNHDADLLSASAYPDFLKHLSYQ